MDRRERWFQYCQEMKVKDPPTLTIASIDDYNEFMATHEESDIITLFKMAIRDGLEFSGMYCILAGYPGKPELILSLNDVPIFTCKDQVMEILSKEFGLTENQKHYFFQNFFFVYISLLTNWDQDNCLKKIEREIRKVSWKLLKNKDE